MWSASCSPLLVTNASLPSAETSILLWNGWNDSNSSVFSPCTTTSPVTSGSFSSRFFR